MGRPPLGARRSPATTIVVHTELPVTKGTAKCYEAHAVQGLALQDDNNQAGMSREAIAAAEACTDEPMLIWVKALTGSGRRQGRQTKGAQPAAEACTDEPMLIWVKALTGSGRRQGRQTRGAQPSTSSWAPLRASPATSQAPYAVHLGLGKFVAARKTTASSATSIPCSSP